MNNTSAANDMHVCKQAVLTAAKRMYQEKLCAGTSGNVSAIDPTRTHILITPGSYDYGIMQEQDIVTIDLDGNRVDGAHRPSSEWRMHAEIYRALPHVNAIVHTHSPYATAFAVLRREIPLILVEMSPFIGGSVEISPYAPQGSAEVGLYAVPMLQRKHACLMANHGVVAVGLDAASAYTSAAYVEDAAKIYHLACSAGEPFLLPLF